MNSISFKNLKFFKSKGTPPKKSKKNASQIKKEKELSFWEKLIRNPFLFLFIFVAILAYSISYLPSKSLPQLTEGEIASSDIIAPSNLTIEDEETTEKREQEAVRAVLPVYNLDPNIFLNTEEKIREFFISGREFLKKPVTAKSSQEFQQTASKKFAIEISSNNLKSLIRVKFTAKIEESLTNLIGKISANGIILSKNLFIHKEQEKGLTLIKGTEGERSIKISEILDMEESKKKLSEEINKLDLPQNEKSLLAALSNIFISPNINYSPIETEARKEQARASVETVFYTIKKGKVIIRKGDEVNKEALKQINIINQSLRAKPSWLTNFSGIFLLFALIFLTLWYYLKSFLKSKEALKQYIMIGIILVLSLIFYKLSILLADTFSQRTGFFLFKSVECYRYAFPFQFGVLLFAFLTTTPIALIYTVINSLLVGYLFEPNFDLMIFSLIGGFAAIYGIKCYGKQKRTTTFQAGLILIAPINIFIIITFHLIKEKMGPIDLFASDLLMGILGGILSAAFAFLFLPVFENIFGIVTQTKLLELTNSDLPIFRQMAMEAPGSYHHSLIVASLAEEAAEKIKLDPMLVKAGALYHDIGKIKRPEYFIENRVQNPDMHKDLKPSMSALVILNHVKEGVEQAKKLRLPKKIREIVEQHHGSSLVRYFFEKAKEEYDPEMQKIGEESYRYPGPIPKSKEAALIMLADSIEAASRSLKSPSETNLKRLIAEIFNNYLQDGQLDDCDFSLKELRAIASSFFATLHTIYQPRVEYPGFDFEMKKKKKTNKIKTTNARNNKSAKKTQDKQK